ncbi:hypothetical protein E3J79_00305 [Candidatus Dependentiae bacterium]|nr:MAG: hypothetical protein E3J79_00305 [Candidatus Dependentiae bacterium]
MTIKIFVLVLSCTVGFSLNAFFEWVTLLTKGTQQVYCFADHHDRCDNWHLNFPHFYHLNSFLQNCDFKDEYKIIVEDFGGKGKPEMLASASPLIELASFCQENKFDVANVEYRFLRKIASEPFLKKIPIFLPGDWVFTCNLLEEFNSIDSRVASFNDGEMLAGYYNEQRKIVLEASTLLCGSFAAYDGLFHEYMEQNIPQQKWKAFVLALFNWDVRLFDAKVIHEIVQARERKKVLLFLGAAHIAQISKTLERLLDYKKVSVIGNERNYDYPDVSFEVADLPDNDMVNAKIALKKEAEHEPLTVDQLKMLFNMIHGLHVNA